MKDKIITGIWMLIMFSPMLLSISIFKYYIEWYILLPFDFFGTIFMVWLFFKWVDWRNKKKYKLIYKGD